MKSISLIKTALKVAIFTLTLFSTMVSVALAQSSTNVGVHLSGVEAVLQASLVVKIVILILVALSVICWAIAISKQQQFKKIKAENDHFDQVFWKTTSLDEMFQKVDSFKNSSHARIFKAAYTEMKKIAESPLMNKTLNSETDSPQLSGIDNLERTLRKSIELEISEMESKLTILASTGSTGPFIGLFGTVWGIMNSFTKIGQTGSASLAAVAPGIAEALITTAIGLAAAIPAVLLYNAFVSEVRKQEIALNNFASDFLNIVKRNFFKN